MSGTLRCFRCGYAWEPIGSRGGGLPKTCPACHTPYWNRERMRDPVTGEWLEGYGPRGRRRHPDAPTLTREDMTVVGSLGPDGVTNDGWRPGDPTFNKRGGVGMAKAGRKTARREGMKDGDDDGVGTDWDMDMDPSKWGL